MLLNYTAVIETLKEINNYDYYVDIENLIEYFIEIENIILIAYYTDILKPLYILTKILQKSDVSLEVFSIEIA